MQKVLRYIGIFFTLVSIYYIVHTVLKIDLDYSAVRFNKKTILLLLLSVAGCALVVFLFGTVWKRIILALAGVKKLPYFFISIYVRTNIAKYLPGNVMHFAGRNFLLNKSGLSHLKIAFSSFLEISFVLITLIFYFLILKQSELLIIINKSRDSWPYIALFLLVIIFVLIGFYRYKKEFIKRIANEIDYRRVFISYVYSFLIYTLVFIILGTILFVFIGYFGSIELGFRDLMNITLYFALAWMAGLIVIGAPGGIGIRESVLLLFLSPVYGEEIIILAILMHRLVFIIGEVLAFGLSFLVKR